MNEESKIDKARVLFMVNSTTTLMLAMEYLKQAITTILSAESSTGEKGRFYTFPDNPFNEVFGVQPTREAYEKLAADVHAIIHNLNSVRSESIVRGMSKDIGLSVDELLLVGRMITSTVSIQADALVNGDPADEAKQKIINRIEQLSGKKITVEEKTLDKDTTGFSFALTNTEAESEEERFVKSFDTIRAKLRDEDE